MDALGIIGAIAGLAGLVTALVSTRRVKSQNFRDCADANESIAAAVKTLIEPLEKRVRDLERELAEWKNWAERLVRQVKKLGHEPVPFVESVAEKQGRW
jgi:hypothetical protein